MRASLVVLLIAACGGTQQAAAPTPPSATCDSITISIEGTASADEPVRVDALPGADAPSAIGNAENAAAHAAIAACHDDHWALESIDCYARATSDDDQRACTAAMPRALQRDLRTHVDAAVHAQSTVTLRRGTEEGWHDVPADTGVPACDDFIRGFNALMSCDKMPEGARESAAGAVQKMIDGFARLRDPDVSPDQKQQAIDGCTKALTALEQNAREMGCPMP